MTTDSQPTVMWTASMESSPGVPWYHGFFPPFTLILPVTVIVVRFWELGLFLSHIWPQGSWVFWTGGKNWRRFGDANQEKAPEHYKQRESREWGVSLVGAWEVKTEDCTHNALSESTECTCISYLFGAVIIFPWPEATERKSAYFSLKFQRGYSLSWQGKYGRRSVKQCILAIRKKKSYCIHTQEAERKNRKWDQTIKPQSLPSVAYLLQKVPPSKGSITSPNSITNCSPSVQTHEPRGYFFFHLNSHTIESN